MDVTLPVGAVVPRRTLAGRGDLRSPSPEEPQPEAAEIAQALGGGELTLAGLRSSSPEPELPEALGGGELTLAGLRSSLTESPEPLPEASDELPACSGEVTPASLPPPELPAEDDVPLASGEVTPVSLPPPDMSLEVMEECERTPRPRHVPEVAAIVITGSSPSGPSGGRGPSLSQAGPAFWLDSEHAPSRKNSKSPPTARAPSMPASSRRASKGIREDGMGFQQRLDTLLAMKDGAGAMARKLYPRFAGKPDDLPGVMQLLEVRWGFPGRLFPLLWTQLRRAAFRRKGDEARLIKVGDIQAPEYIEEEEWEEAFARWLEALRSRCAPASMSRKSLVRSRTNSQFVEQEDYFQGPSLGEGAYAEVYLMFNKTLGVQRAVKTIDSDKLAIPMDKVMAEVNVLKALDHPHIVRIYETFERRKVLHIVMDLAEGGDLATLLRQRGQLKERWVCEAAQQMSSALEYMHSKGVIHCDMKPANTMILRPVDPRKDEQPHILLVDFGISEMMHDSGRAAGGAIKVRGTPLYLSPEGFDGDLTEKCDMWSLGVMIFEMLVGRRPFDSEGGSVVVLWCRVAQSEPPLDDLPVLAQEVVRGLLEKDPIARLTAQECCEQEWFRQRRSSVASGCAGPAKSGTVTKIKSMGHGKYFHRVSMFAVAAGVSMKDMEDLFEVFSSIDHDRSGCLTRDQFARGLRQLDIQEDADQLMAILDMDQNGKISYTEFLAGVLGTTEELPESKVREAFDMFDLDGDGTISLQELRIMLSGDGPLVEVLPDGQTVDEVMEEVGGGEGFISFDNFLSFMRQSASAPRAVKSGPPEGQALEAQALQKFDEMVQDLRSRSNSTAGSTSGRPQRQRPSGSPPAASPPALSPAAGSPTASSSSRGPRVVVQTCETLPAEARAPSSASGGSPREPDGHLAPLHQWLLEARGQSHLEPALRDFLDFGGERLDGSAVAANLQGICTHFLAGVSLARMLAAGLPGDGRAVRNAVSKKGNPGSPPRVWSVSGSARRLSKDVLRHRSAKDSPPRGGTDRSSPSPQRLKPPAANGKLRPEARLPRLQRAGPASTALPPLGPGKSGVPPPAHGVPLGGPSPPKYYAGQGRLRSVGASPPLRGSPDPLAGRRRG